MQFFQNPQVFFRKEGRVGLSQIEGGRLHEGADVGAGNMHQLRQIKDRAEAAGQIFREVAVLRRGRAFYGAVGFSFKASFSVFFFSGQKELSTSSRGDRRMPSAFPTARRSSSQCSMKEMTRSVMGSPKK